MDAKSGPPRGGIVVASATFLAVLLTAGFLLLNPAHSSTTHTVATSAQTDDLAFAPISSNKLVNTSGAAITADVIGVTGPTWNTIDGTAPVDTGKPQTFYPTQYRVASLRVSSVLYSTPPFSVDEAKSIRVTLYGTGGMSSDANPDSGILNNAFSVDPNEMDGPLNKGDKVVVFLKHFGIPFEDGAHDAVVVTNHYQGIFRVDGSTAFSALGDRSLPLDALLAAIRDEKARGLLDLTVPQAEWSQIDFAAGIPGLGTFGALKGALPKSESPPADRGKAEVEIQAAVSAAYGSTPGLPFDVRMRYVENAADIVSAFGSQADAFIARLGPPGVTVDAAYFESPTRAHIEYLVAGKAVGDHYRQGYVQFVDGQWVVSRTTFCSDLAILHVQCP